MFPVPVDVCANLIHGQFVFLLTVIMQLRLATIFASIPCQID
jgi:hypothetical protein